MTKMPRRIAILRLSTHHVNLGTPRIIDHDMMGSYMVIIQAGMTIQDFDPDLKCVDYELLDLHSNVTSLQIFYQPNIHINHVSY